MQRLSLQVRPISLAIALALASLGATAQTAPVAAAAAPLHVLDIPAQPAVQALQRLVELTKLQLVYSPDIVNNLTTKPVQGSFTARDALSRMLDGSGLEVVDTGVNALTIRPTGAASGLAREPQMLQPVVVTGISHLASTARTGTRTDADPMTLPMSITTVDKDLLAQQQVLNLRDAVTNVAGVSQFNSDGSFSMRGFAAGIMRDGNLIASGLNYDAPTIAISRVEVVKGPEAIIAGVTSGYGGVVNVITKTPQTAPITEVSGTGGSRGYYEVGVDIGRPLTADKSLLVRFVASKQGAGSTIVGYDGASSEYAAPSLTWRNKGTGTEITAQYEYQKSRTAPGTQVFTDQPDLTNDLKMLRYGPATDGKDTKSRVASLSVVQRISDDWDLAFKFSDDRRTTLADSSLTGIGTPFGVLFPEVLSIGARNDNAYVTKTGKLELKGNFETGPVEHKLLLAYDNVRASSDQGSRFLSITSTNIDTGAVTDLASTIGPIFGGIPSPRSGGVFESKENGVLVMDQLLWGDWVALAGWREIRYEPTLLGTSIGTFRKSLPSLGVLYRVSPTVSLYGSASKGFTPNFGLFGSDGAAVAPENAQQFEVGVKSLLMDRKIAASFALYSIKQRNVAVEDPSLVGQLCGVSTCYISVPGVQSTGAEIEVSGQVAKGLGLRASYSYNRKKADTAEQTGLFYAPHQASLWAIYNFGGQAGEGWWTGVGLQARSATKGQVTAAGDLGNRGQVRFDLSGGYQAKQWSVVAGIKNVADARLYTVGSGVRQSGEVYQPREFYFSTRYNFE